MKRVLVTGASGFIGRHVPGLLLSKEYEVHTVSRGERLAQWPGEVVHHSGDLLRPEGVEGLLKEVGPTHLLHLAWYAEHGRFWSAPQNLDWVAASLTLLKLFSKQGGLRAVFAGSCAEYDWRYGYCSEALTPRPGHTLYGISKNSLYEVARAFCAGTGVELAWGRIFLLYGPYESQARLVPSVTRALLCGKPAQTTHGEQMRDMLHVADVAGAFVALLESPAGGAVNIGSGEPVALKEVVAQIGELTGHQELINLGALEAPKDDPPLLLPDITRLRDEVGWQPRYSLKEGLAETVGWWKNRLA